MTIDEDTLAAYADDELDEAGRFAVEAAIANDPAIAERLAAHAALRGRLAAAYEPVLEEPLPAALLATVSAPRATPRTWPRLAGYAAIAASLIIGVFVGRSTIPPPLVKPDMTAQARLAGVLESGLASDPQGAIRIGLTFPAHGGYCRTFQTPDSAGLACRHDGVWTVETLSPSETRGAYRTASSMPAALAANLQARMTGEPLDAEAERRARDAGWKP